MSQEKNKETRIKRWRNPNNSIPSTSSDVYIVCKECHCTFIKEKSFFRHYRKSHSEISFGIYVPTYSGKNLAYLESDAILNLEFGYLK